MYPKVSIHIVAWNSMDFIPELLKSIFAQTYADFNVLIVDNASDDGLEPFVRAHYPQAMILRNARNLGFATAHNQAVRYAIDHWGKDVLDDRYVLVTNPDVILSPTFLENLMKGVAEEPTAGSYQGKLLLAFRENMQDEALAETVCSERIDSTGLRMHRDRTFSDRGAGELDTSQYDQARDIFGPTGALALYRASALDAVKLGDECFDVDFFAYKEDVDLAWRLRHAGYASRYVPEAVAYHHRGMFGNEKMGWRERIRNRKAKSPTRNWYSTRNHVLLLAKNEPFWSGVLASPFILWFELRRLAYVVLFEPFSLSAYSAAAGLIPKMISKRFARPKV